MADPSRPEPDRQEITTSAAVALVAGASYFALAIGLLRGILYTRVLSPTSRGIVQIVFLFGQYLGYAHLGITHGLTKRIPLLLGEGKEEEAARLEECGITSVFLLTLGAAAVMWAYAAGNAALGTPTRVAIGIGGFHLLLGQLAGVYRIVLRSRHRFGLIARSTLVEAIVLFALVVAGAQLLDAPGTVFGWALGMGVLCLYLLSFRLLPSRPQVDVRTAWELARVGLPVLGVSLADIFVRTADNLVVAKLRGAEALGYYGLAWQLASYLYNVPASAGFVIMPKILRTEGAGGPEAMRRSVIDMTTVFAILMPPLAGAAALAGPVLVRVVLPRYEPAVGALEIFMVSVVFIAIPIALKTAMIARNREVELMVWQGLGGLLIGGSVAFLTTRGASLAQLAAAGAVGLLVTGAVLTWRGLSVVGMRPRESARYCAGLVLPFVYCVGLLLALKLWLPRQLGLTSPLAADLVGLPLFAALAAPLVWVAERMTGILTKMRSRAAPAVVAEEREEPVPPDGGEGPL